MPKADKTENAIRQSVCVDCEIEDAFHLFTEAFGDWWPLALYSIEGERAQTCVIEPWAGGRVFERSQSGKELEWGSVTAWDPPNRVSLAWHPGSSERGETRGEAVDVRFDVTADGTRVTVTHTGWDASGVAVCILPGTNAEPWPALVKQFYFEFVMAQVLVTA